MLIGGETVNDDIRKLLGTVAGAITGSRAGSATSKTHPFVGAAGGGFAGGTFGLLFAELVNAAQRLSTEPSGTDPSRRDPLDNRDVAEGIGIAKGFAVTWGLVAGLLAVYGEQLSEWIRDDPDREPSLKHVKELITPKLEEWLRTADQITQETFRGAIAAGRREAEQSGVPLEQTAFLLDVEYPRQELDVVKRAIAERFA